MSKHALGLYHHEKKKRKGLDQDHHYLVQWKKFVDRAIYIVGVSGPIMTIPQAFKIWSTQSAAGVSLISWGFYIFVSSFWLMYGVLHRANPIIITYAAWATIECIIVIGILKYS